MPQLRTLEEHIDERLSHVELALSNDATAIAPEQPDTDVFNAEIEELHKHLSRLAAEQASSQVWHMKARESEARVSALEQKFREVQSAVEQDHEVLSSHHLERTTGKAEVGAISKILDEHVVDTKARLHFVEGELELLRPLTGQTRDSELWDKIIEVAKHLEVVDDLAAKVDMLEDRCTPLNAAIVAEVPALPRQTQGHTDNSHEDMQLEAEPTDLNPFRFETLTDHQRGLEQHVSKLQNCGGELQTLAGSTELRCLVEMLENLDRPGEEDTDAVDLRQDYLDFTERLESQVTDLRDMVRSVMDKDAAFGEVINEMTSKTRELHSAVKPVLEQECKSIAGLQEFECSVRDLLRINYDHPTASTIRSFPAESPVERAIGDEEEVDSDDQYSEHFSSRSAESA